MIIKETGGGCRLCTSWRHSAARCHQRETGVRTCCVRNKEGICNEEHHKSLHLSQSMYCLAGYNPAVHKFIIPRITCLLCKGQHTYGEINEAKQVSSRLTECYRFKNITVI